MFRPYTFFKSFEIKYPSDRVLVYVMLYIQECVEFISARAPPYLEGVKLLKSHALRPFAIPGETMFPLNNIYQKPIKSEIGSWSEFCRLDSISHIHPPFFFAI